MWLFSEVALNVFFLFGWSKIIIWVLSDEFFESLSFLVDLMSGMILVWIGQMVFFSSF